MRLSDQAGEKRILITNDDGVYSPGLKILHEALSPLGRVYVVVPETPKSATGLGLTLHKPLRLEKIRYWGMELYVTNGTPSDVIYLALNEVSPSLDLITSGINIGDNTSIQVILSSGTVGAAAQGALLNLPAIAFSADVIDPSDLESPDYSRGILMVARSISEEVLRAGMPRGVDLLNVNFPRELGGGTRVEVTRPAYIKYLQRLTVNYDPNGKKYYWLYGETVEPEKGSDLYAVKVDKSISITPLKLNLTYCASGEREPDMSNIVRAAVKGLKSAYSQ